jgi:hypothetical protein
MIKIKEILTSVKLRIKVFLYLKFPIQTPSDIVRKHFVFWSSTNHPNREAFEVVFNKLQGFPAQIIETGTSAWGTDSTRLWDRYVAHYGGSFKSVDIRSEPARRLEGQLGDRTELIVANSIDFLSSNFLDSHIDVFFLDSWDVDWAKPLAAASHGFTEFQVIKSRLKDGCILFVDDTPNSVDLIPNKFTEVAINFKNEYGVLPGKGAFILKHIMNDSKVEFLHHSYSLVVKFL